MLNTHMMQEIIDLKLQGYTPAGIRDYYEAQGIKPPSMPTIRKYFEMDILPDNLGEKLEEHGIVAAAVEGGRVYDTVFDTAPGEQMLIDFGEIGISRGLRVHFICLLLRYSRYLVVYAQDHKYNAEEACQAIYRSFRKLGGRPSTLVIDQDAVFVASETSTMALSYQNAILHFLLPTEIGQFPTKSHLKVLLYAVICGCMRLKFEIMKYRKPLQLLKPLKFQEKRDLVQVSNLWRRTWGSNQG